MSTSTEPHDRGADPAATADPAVAVSPRICRGTPGRAGGAHRGARARDDGYSDRRTSEVPDDFGEFALTVAPEVNCGESVPPYGALRVDDPGELIAALPAMLGFVPERSLVVAVLRPAAASPLIEAVVRLDLGAREGRRARAKTFGACIAQICAVEDACQVLAVVVDDRLREPARHRGSVPGGAAATHAAVIPGLDERLRRRGIDLAGAWAVRDIAAGRRWWNLFEPEQHGTVEDPTASPVAMAQVLDGRAIRGSRAELTALVAAEPELVAGVAELLDAAGERAHERFARAVCRGTPDDYRRSAAEFVLWQIANTESGIDLTADEIAGAVVALRDVMVRDSMFALAVGEHAAAAERLWLTLVRATSGPDRADAAVLLGYSAYIRGDGPFAGIALDAASDADPDHPLARLLETSLRTGMRPESLRRLARSGYAVASRFGIDLGTGLT
ncbi:DUF4192 domain-containing protein [Nocardia arizonensis]|uniref:DUF4192 domain-containing protein n=1 Tax=Nocardia arizonensis TaxID=1141647 RepID=UPI0006D28554|nr:DUF4192 domain-containing protein [Nocardia arizonensis]